MPATSRPRWHSTTAPSLTLRTTLDACCCSARTPTLSTMRQCSTYHRPGAPYRVGIRTRARPAPEAQPKPARGGELRRPIRPNGHHRALQPLAGVGVPDRVPMTRRAGEPVTVPVTSATARRWLRRRIGLALQHLSDFGAADLTDTAPPVGPRRLPPPWVRLDPQHRCG